MGSFYVMRILLCATVYAVFVAGQELVLMPVSTQQVKPLGSTLLLTCKVTLPDSGQEDVDYNLEWTALTNGVPRGINSRTGRVYVEHIDLNERKLYITRIEERDAGIYSCKAVINNEERWKNLTLALFRDITFHDAPLQQNMTVDTDASVRCVVDGQPEPKVTWRFAGSRINFKRSPKYILEDGGLTIKNVSLQDKGVYTCRAEVETDGRYGERKIMVNVHEPPLLTSTFDDQIVVEGDAVSISCAASGSPDPTFVFRKNGELLVSTDHVTADSDAGIVEFIKAYKSDEGNYTCTAVNDAGNHSHTAHLVVRVRPHIYEFQSVTAEEGATAELVCRSQGSPVPQLHFSKFGESESLRVGKNDNDKIEVFNSSAGELKLTVHDLVPSDTAQYTCSASSDEDLGTHEMTASITVHYKPQFLPDQVSYAYTWAGQHHVLECRLLAEPVATVDWFVRGVKLENNDTFHIISSDSNSSLEVNVGEGDQQWIYNNYTCEASNALGSANFSIELRRALVPSHPRSANVTNVLPTMVDVYVQPPEEDGGMPITHYVVSYENKSVDFPFDYKLKLPDLLPNTSYIFTIRARNAVGAGNFISVPVTIPPPRQPSPVVIASAAGSSVPDSYTVRWEVLYDGGLPVIQYRLRIRPVVVKGAVNDTVDSLSDWKELPLVDSEKVPMFEHHISGLSPRTSYEIEITARNDVGWSKRSERFIFTTSGTDRSHGDSSAQDHGVTQVLDVKVFPATAVTSFDGEHLELTERDSSSLGPGFGVVVGIIIAVLLVLLIVIDVSCYFVNGCGALATICSHVCGHHPTSKEKTMEEGDSDPMLKKQPHSERLVEASVPLSDEVKNKGDEPADDEQLNPQSTEEIKRNGAEEKQKPNDAVPSPEKSLVSAEP